MRLRLVSVARVMVGAFVPAAKLNKFTKGSTTIGSNPPTVMAD